MTPDELDALTDLVTKPRGTMKLATPAPKVRRGELPALARSYAEKYGLDPDLFERQINQESGFNPFARSSAGALGLSQMMPATGRAYGLAKSRDFFDPNKSLEAGARHMRDLLDSYDGDYDKALSAYHGGPDTRQWGPKTRHYVRTIRGGKVAKKATKIGTTLDSLVELVTRTSATAPNVPEPPAAPESDSLDALVSLVTKATEPSAKSATLPTPAIVQPTMPVLRDFKLSELLEALPGAEPPAQPVLTGTGPLPGVTSSQIPIVPETRVTMTESPRDAVLPPHPTPTQRTRSRYPAEDAVGNRPLSPRQQKLEQERVRQDAQKGARGVYVPVAEIERVRAREGDDAALRFIVDQAAQQFGLSPAEVEALGNPFDNIVEPGTDRRSSLDAIIRQGRSGEGTARAGVAEFRVDPVIVQRINAALPGLRPGAVMERAAAEQAQAGVRQTLPIPIGAGATVEIEVPESLRQPLYEASAGAAQAGLGMAGSAATGAGVLVRQLTHFVNKDAPTPMSDALISLGDRTRKAFEGSLAPEPGQAPGVTRGVAGGLMSALGFAAMGGHSRVAAGLLGALTQTGDFYTEAKQAGLSDRDAEKAALWGVPLGLTELWGLGGAASRATAAGREAAIKGIIKSFARGAFREIPEEQIQELTQTVLSDLIAKKYWDPQRQVAKDLPFNLLIATISAGVFGGGTHAISTALTPDKAGLQKAVSDATSQLPEAAATVSQQSPTQPGVSNAVEERQVESSDRGELPGVRSGEGVPADQSEVRQGESGQAADSRNLEGVAQEPQAVERHTNLDIAAHDAATSPVNLAPEPTEAQKKAGNYAKGHVKVAGLDISIENPEGSTRSGTDPDGKPWSVEMESHYGYVRRSTGNDQSQVDVFIRPGTDTDYSGPVFVVNQANAKGGFDEHKVMLGWSDEQSARQGYLENYQEGAGRIASVAEFDSPAEFKQWLKTGDLKQPAASTTKQGVVVSQSEPQVPGTAGIVKRASQSERRAKQEGAVDKHTGLQNKNQWLGARARVDADPKREVVVLDVNDLKTFNDQHGHDVGDRYLAHVGKVVLEEAERAGISARQAFRTGGDEIAIDAPKGKGKDLVKRIKQRVAEFQHGGITGSIAGGVGPTEKRADAFMYIDKREGKRRKALAKSTPVTNSKEFRAQWEKAIPDLSPQQADALEQVGAAMARGYAKITGGSESEFYSRFAGIRQSDQDHWIQEGQRQGVKGATEFLADGRALIHAFEKADVSTALHELAHVARRYLDADSMKAVEGWAGVAKGDWTRTAEERFARGFERYWREGKAPNDRLAKIFESIKQWMTEVYRNIRGTAIDIEVTPEVQAVFDRIVGEERPPARLTQETKEVRPKEPTKKQTGVDESDHWNFGRSTFSNRATEDAFRAVVRKAVEQGGTAHKDRVSRNDHMSRVEQLSPDLIPEIKGLRQNLIVSREVFTAAAQYAQTLTRQAQQARNDLAKGGMKPSEAFDLEQKIAGLEHDAAEIMSHTIGVRSEFGRNLALLSIQKTDQMQPERALQFASKLAERYGIDRDSPVWKRSEDVFVAESNRYQAAQSEIESLKKQIADIKDKRQKPPKKKQAGWKATMLDRLTAKEAEAASRLSERPNVLYQEDALPASAYDASVLLAAQIARGGKLNDIIESLERKYPTVFQQYGERIKAQADQILREERRRALVEVSADREHGITARQELARDVREARVRLRQAQLEAERKRKEIEAAWDADTRAAEDDAVAAWDAADQSLGAARDKEQIKKAVEKQTAIQKRAERRLEADEAFAAEEAEAEQERDAARAAAEHDLLTRETIAELQKAIDEERAFARQQREAVREEARRVSQAARQSQIDERERLAEQALEDLEQAKEAAFRARMAELDYQRERRQQQVKAEAAQRRWDYRLKEKAQTTRARINDPNHQMTVENLADIGAGLARQLRMEQPTDAPEQFHREMQKLGGTLYSKNASKVRDLIADRLSSAREAHEARRLSERAAGKDVGAKTEAQERQAAADYAKWAPERLARLEIELRQQEKRKQEAMRTLAKELAKLEQRSTWDKAVDASGLLRSLKSSVDLPFFRQGIVPMFTHPIRTAQAFGASLSTWSQEQMDRRIDELERHPLATLMREAGLEITSIMQRREPLSLAAMEEQFQSRVARWFPHVRVSERQFTIGMDSIRVSLFSDYASDLMKTYDPATHPEVYQELARLINIMTGRGDIAHLKKIGPSLNVALWSTRLMLSRLQWLNLLVNPVAYRRMPPAVRKIAARNAGTFLLSQGALLFVAQMLGLTTFNPDDDDFMKVRIPGTNTRYDFTGGFQGYIKTLFKLARSGYRKATGATEFKGEGVFDTLSRFGRGKLAPGPGLAIDFGTGETFIGEPFDWKRAGTYKKLALDTVLPMASKDISEAISTDGLRGIIAVPFILAGTGATTFRSREMPDRSGSEAERYARGFVRGHMADKEQTLEEYRRRQLLGELAVAIKEGKATTEHYARLEKHGGPITSKEHESLQRRSTLSPLMFAFESLSATEGQQVYDVATPSERKQLAPILLKKILKSDEYGKMSPDQRREAFDRIMRDVPAEGTGDKTPAEWELLSTVDVARDKAREQMESLPEFKTLSDEAKSAARSELSRVFSPYSMPKEAERMSPENRTKRADRSRKLVQSLVDRGVVDRQIQQILLKAKRRAA